MITVRKSYSSKLGLRLGVIAERVASIEVAIDLIVIAKFYVFAFLGFDFFGFGVGSSLAVS